MSGWWLILAFGIGLFVGAAGIVVVLGSGAMSAIGRGLNW